MAEAAQICTRGPDHGHTKGEDQNFIVHMIQKSEPEQTFQNRSNTAPPVCTGQNSAETDRAISLSLPSQVQLYACAQFII